MRYFKNTELAKIYNVSEKSVRNWINAAKEGKLDLQLFDNNGRLHIANVTKNTETIEKLVANGKKYKNSRGYKVVTPSAKFYRTFTKNQVRDIITSIDSRLELPLKYSYLDGGAAYWDQYVKRLSAESVPNMLNRTVDLLGLNIGYIDELISDKRHVNIVDVGAGNGLPARNLINHILKSGRTCRYIAVDISRSMLDIVESNIKEWFGEKVILELCEIDVEYDRFNDLIHNDYDKDAHSANIILVLGGTIQNLRRPEHALINLNNSMESNDILLYNTKLDTPNSRRYFDFNIHSGVQELTPRHRLALDMLKIDPSMYTVEQSFDDKNQARVIGIKLTSAIKICFSAFDPSLRDIELQKDQLLTLWRFWHQNVSDISQQFEYCGFDLKVVTKTVDDEYVGIICKISR